jgi:hypothetical protein
MIEDRMMKWKGEIFAAERLWPSESSGRSCSTSTTSCEIVSGHSRTMSMDILVFEFYIHKRPQGHPFVATSFCNRIK